MRVGVYQFPGSADIQRNHETIKTAVINAAANQVRVLVFQECAACGYPPVETPEIKEIDYKKLDEYFVEIKQLAKKNGMFIALGTVRKENSKYYNSIKLINPEGEVAGSYDKRALWGWDTDNFTKGEDMGIFDIDGIRMGFRICFEVRFPEYFRELFKSKAELCFVSFCDVSAQDYPARYDIIKAHLVTRAVENIMTVISVNSISEYQTAPTAVIDSNGLVVSEAPKNREYLLVYDHSTPAVDFGAKGRIVNSIQLLEPDVENR